MLRKPLSPSIKDAQPNDARYALAAAAGGAVAWDWDLQTKIFFVDPSLRGLLGYDDSQFSNWIVDWARLVHPQDRHMLLHAARSYLVGRSPRFEVEHRMLRRDGEMCWFATRGAAIRDENGEAIRLLGVSTDVTELKRTQLALRESEQRFLQLAENIPQIFWLMSADMSRLLYISPAYEAVTGMPCSELYQDPRKWLEAVHPDDRPAIAEAVMERREGHRSGRAQWEYRYLLPDGTIRWMQAMVLPIADENGTPYRIAGIAEDITDRKTYEVRLKQSRGEMADLVRQRTAELTATVERLQQEISDRVEVEQALRESEAKFRRLFESNIIGAMIANVEGYITDANEALLELTGYTRDDLPLRWDHMTPPDSQHLDVVKRRELLEKGIAAPYEKEYFRKDGSRVPILIGAALLDSQAGTCIAFVVDLTRRKSQEEEIRELNARLEQASRLSVMGEMVAALAHEVHQPLTVISNYANGTVIRLKRRQITVGELIKRLREISAQSQRAADVLRRIRQFIQLREPEREETCINSIVRDALKLARFDRDESRIEVAFRPEGETVPVFADPIQITQVLLNLILNAFQSMQSIDDRPRRLTIETVAHERGLVEVLVSDTGHGVPLERQSRIFEQFYTTKSQGLGMGLSISRSIVESHGGQLWCESNPGEGAVFRFTIPRHGSERGEEPSADATQSDDAIAAKADGAPE